ncbi:DMT family transporter [Glutamicibacter endophyticus]|uniref:DMT family transporter n=1 Tax=Glutamicibacter endophyticus TaxID=1522174 RepID=UPI003AEF4001
MASPTRPPKNLGFLLLIVALLGGSLLPIQSRINGALSTTLGDPVTASTISFCMGLVALSLLAVVLPKARRAVVGIPRVLKRREFPGGSCWPVWWEPLPWPANRSSFPRLASPCLPLPW